MDFGVSVSQPGFDVKDASDTQLVFSSKFGTYASACILLSGTEMGSSTGGEDIEFNVSHTLGETPFVIVYYKTSVNPDNWQWFPHAGGSILLPGDSPIPFSLNIFNDHFILNFSANAGENVTIRYYLFNSVA